MGKFPSSFSFALKDSEPEHWECQGVPTLLLRPHDRRETRLDPVLGPPWQPPLLLGHGRPTDGPRMPRQHMGF